MRLPPMPARWPQRRLEPEQLPEDRDLLANIQGNIVRAHGRTQARLVFFMFGEDARANREALIRAAELVTSGEQQRLSARAYQNARGRGLPPPQVAFLSLALSAAGLRACGMDEAAFPPGLDRPAAAFARGMIADRVILGDPPAAELEAAFRMPVHGMWLVAGESPEILQQALRPVAAWVHTTGGSIRALETCFHWRPEPHKRWACREPFGYADGISNPEFVAVAPANHWSIDLGLDRVLIEDEGPHHGGSFMVVRKLEQNVAAFREFEARLAASLRETLPPERAAEAEHLAEAVIIGRDRDGIPLADLQGEGLNDFSFAADGQAARCPFHAHIRKVNPRDDNPYATAISTEDARRFQFVRRSMVYGDPARLTLTGPDWPTGGVGLWFIGYMRDIEEQFREMQGRWMRDRYFPGHNRDGLPDPLLFGGMRVGGEAATTWRWRREGRMTCVAGLSQFVRPRGGEYLYVPPLRWLANAGRTPTLTRR